MNPGEFQNHIRTSRATWEAALALIPTAQMDQPDPDGGWSVKDHIAYVAFFENEMLNLLRTRSLESASPLWALPTDERNRVIYEQNHTRPLAEVQREASQIYAELLPLLESLTEEELNNPAHLGMLPEWVPWQILAGSTYEHYLHHAELIKK